MQSYRINAIDDVRKARIAALEEIAEEGIISFSGVARTAKRIEDIVTGIGFEKQTMHSPKEGAIDYVIYMCRRDGHVDILADRDLGTKRMGVRWYHIPENEFAMWQEHERTGEGYLYSPGPSPRATTVLAVGSFVFAFTQLMVTIYGADIGILPNEIRDTALGISAMVAIASPALVTLGILINGQMNPFGSYLIAKEKSAWLHLAEYEQAHRRVVPDFVPQCRVAVERDDTAAYNASEHEIGAGMKTGMTERR